MPEHKIVNAIRMRENPTEGEAKLVEICQNACPAWMNFGVQVPMFGYVADVFFKKRMLVIEADGGYHLSPEQKALDAKRDAVLEAHGIRTLRFMNSQILNSPASVQQRIYSELMFGDRSETQKKKRKRRSRLPKTGLDGAAKRAYSVELSGVGLVCSSA